jgi:acetyl-CoA carboxylase biotin carboxyl carrier protein
MTLSNEDVREILKLIDETELDELHIETEDFSLHVSRHAGGDGADWSRRAERDRASPSPPAPTPAGEPKHAPESGQGQGHAGSGDVVEDGLVTIESPMLGTFYRAQSPSDPPFVEVGSQVQADTIVCIMEVMKMMNSVPAGVAGTIVEVCLENAALAEFGEPLFRVKAS